MSITDIMHNPRKGIESMLWLVIGLTLLPTFLSLLLGTFVNFSNLFSGTAIGSFFATNGIMTLIVAVVVFTALLATLWGKKSQR